MVNAFPCRACHKNVNKNHKAIFCNTCGTWIHIKCNNLNSKDYDKLVTEDDDIDFICICCLAENIPFSQLSDRNFDIAVIKGINYLIDETDNNLHFLNNAQLETIKKFQASLKNKRSLDNDDDDAIQPIDCNYYSTNEFLEAKFDSNKSFSILHLNIHSIQRHIEEFRTTLLLLNFHFDFIAISESKLREGVDPSVNIELEGYS